MAWSSAPSHSLAPYPSIPFQALWTIPYSETHTHTHPALTHTDTPLKHTHTHTELAKAPSSLCCWLLRSGTPGQRWPLFL